MLLVQTTDHVAVLTLNRPEKLNALDGELRGAMLDAVASVQSDDDVRAVIFAGAGRAFCSSADLTSGGSGATAPPTQHDRLDDLGSAVKRSRSMVSTSLSSPRSTVYR